MTHYASLVCFLAAASLSHGNAIGYGYGYGLSAPVIGPVISAPVYHPAAISTANMVKGAPIPVIKTYAAPVYSDHIVLSKPLYPYYGYGLAKTYSYPYAYGYGLAKSYAPLTISDWGALGYSLGYHHHKH